MKNRNDDKSSATDFEKTLRAPFGEKFHLRNHATDYCAGFSGKDEATAQLQQDIESLATLQEKLYADNRHSVLIIFQAMDAAGKDGTIKHVMSGLNPQGCQVTSFKHPSEKELEFNFLWRHVVALPEKGYIGIFNRSHYENVLVCKIHPELVLQERLPNIAKISDIDKEFWQRRYDAIRNFERELADNGTTIIKFFLHVSKHEQAQRLLARLEDPEKHWKFSFSDIREREHWEDYMTAYEEAINATARPWAPWYIVPSDKKWFARLAVARIIKNTIAALPLRYPDTPASVRKEFPAAKRLLKQELRLKKREKSTQGSR